MWHHKLHRGGSLGAKELDDIGSDSNVGITALPQDLTINGQTVSPTFRYEAKNATTGLWTATVGDNLTGAGSGGLVGLDTPMLDDAEAVNGQGTRYWGPGTLQQVGLRDAVYETVFRLPETATASESIFATRTSSKGVYIRRSASANSIQFYMAGATGARNLTTVTLTPGTWYHLMCLYDASGSSITYVDTDAGGVTSGSIGSVDDDSGPYMNFVSTGSIQIAYFAAWYGLDMLDTHLQADLAQERFARLSGSYAAGFAAWPTQANLRNSVATLEKRGASGGQKLFTVGARWPCLEMRPDKHLRYGTGFNCEGQHTNLIPYSDDFSNAAWFSLNIAKTPAADYAPNGELASYKITESATTGAQYLEDQFGTAPGTYTFSVFAKAIGRQYVYLTMYSATDGIASVWFDLSNGVAMTKTLVDGASVRYFRDGYFLISLTDTRASTETKTARIGFASGDGVTSYAGDGRDASYIWGAQVTETPYPVSRIKTEGATVTRLSDVIRYDGLSLPSKGTIACDLLIPDHDNAVNLAACYASESGLSSDRIALYVATNDSTYGFVRASGGTNGDASVVGDMSNGVWNEARINYETNALTMYRNGVGGVTDTSVDNPTGLNRINIGADSSETLYLNGLVRARLYSKPTTKFVTDFGDIMSYAFGYISTPAAVAQSTSYANVGGTFSSVLLSDFTLSAGGVLTYTGATTKRFDVTATCSGAISSGSPLVTTTIEKNGTSVTGSESQRDVGSSSIGAWATTAIVELANGDTINIATKVDTGTPNLTMEAMSLTAEEVS